MKYFQKIIILISLFLGLKTMLIAAPVPASCSPATLNYCCGFGITNLVFNTMNNTSNDGVDGYSDFTAFSTTVLEGQTYNLAIQTTAASTQNYAAWIDFNNDGVFDDVTERVFTATSQMNTSGNVTIPVGAVLNTDLRLRISSDYDARIAPTPCGDPTEGQVEDYTIVITSNPNPPIVAFSVPDTLVCNGDVCFTDETLNLPTSWLWYFGDGSTSLQQSPCHTYLADGNYTVSLIATNANGSDADTIVNYITVNTAIQLVAPNCTPATTSYCCGYGISEVMFVDINNSSIDGVEGYQDFSCTNSTVVIEGDGFLFSTNTGTNSAQDIRVWIDFDNDGIFNNTNELVMDAPNSFSPSQVIIIPFGVLLNTPIRLRVSADIVGVAQSACDDNDRGQTEDYSIVVDQPNGINESIDAENRFVVYPNPARGYLNVKNLSTNEKIEHLGVYNSLGQQVFYSTEISNKITRVNISEYDKGFYSLRIITSKEMVVKKFMVY
tara:strand:+ start:1352 stop:2833 length:1482 start_codon:yes stop_codon:yes gene_type:complete